MESSATASDGGRFRQAVKLCRRAKQLLDDAGLQAHEVRPGVLVPILEGATLADDDEALQDRWAALLANAATKPADAIPPSFPYILGQLSATDAKLLDVVFDAVTTNAEHDLREDAVNARELAHIEAIDGRDFDLGSTTSFACESSAHKRPTGTSSPKRCCSRRSATSSYARAGRQPPRAGEDRPRRPCPFRVCRPWALLAARIRRIVPRSLSVRSAIVRGAGAARRVQPVEVRRTREPAKSHWPRAWSRMPPQTSLVYAVCGAVRAAISNGRYWARTSDLRLVEAALSQLS